MITEDYISFETAKLLKDKGFEEYTPISYRLKDGYFLQVPCRNGFDEGLVSKITLQMAMKWLREKHNFHCTVDYDFVLGWYCQITDLKETVEYDYEEMKHYHPDKSNGFSSSEEATEAAIKYCLENLI